MKGARRTFSLHSVVIRRERAPHALGEPSTPALFSSRLLTRLQRERRSTNDSAAMAFDSDTRWERIYMLMIKLILASMSPKRTVDKRTGTVASMGPVLEDGWEIHYIAT